MDVVHPAWGAYKAALSKLTYDLQGRKVDTPGKGFYIIAGKKIIVK